MNKWPVAERKMDKRSINPWINDSSSSQSFLEVSFLWRKHTTLCWLSLATPVETPLRKKCPPQSLAYEGPPLAQALLWTHYLNMTLLFPFWTNQLFQLKIQRDCFTYLREPAVLKGIKYSPLKTTNRWCQVVPFVYFRKPCSSVAYRL